MDVFTACLRFVTAAAFTTLSKFLNKAYLTDWNYQLRLGYFLSIQAFTAALPQRLC
jgi:hypothetical protein